MTIKKTLISFATAAAVVAGGSLAIAQTTGTQAPMNPGTGQGTGQQGTTGTGSMDGTPGSGMGTTGQTDTMGRTGTQSARMDRN